MITSKRAVPEVSKVFRKITINFPESNMTVVSDVMRWDSEEEYQKFFKGIHGNTMILPFEGSKIVLSSELIRKSIVTIKVVESVDL